MNVTLTVRTIYCGHGLGEQSSNSFHLIENISKIYITETNVYNPICLKFFERERYRYDYFAGTAANFPFVNGRCHLKRSMSFITVDYSLHFKEN